VDGGDRFRVAVGAGRLLPYDTGVAIVLGTWAAEVQQGGGRVDGSAL
jgi:hypothetical protein